MISGPEITPASQHCFNLRMLRGEIRGRELRRWMGYRRLQDADHALHCLLLECFGELAPKPFRAVMDRAGLKGVLYGYCTAHAEQLRESAAICADPLQARILPLESLQDKPMPTEWSVGRSLGFEVRIRPVVRKAKTTGRYRDEQDAFQQEAYKYPHGEIPFTREDIYVRWLAHQLEQDGAAHLDSEATRLASFRILRSSRRLHSRYVAGPDAVMRGTLTVEKPDSFGSLLARGIGRHRSYGYGMLLLRPPPSS